jgi:glutathione S-transferase
MLSTTLCIPASLPCKQTSVPLPAAATWHSLDIAGSGNALAPADSAAAAAVDRWLQWEAGQLRAAVFAGGDAAAAALAELDAQLSKSGPSLAGNSITLADVSAWPACVRWCVCAPTSLQLLWAVSHHLHSQTNSTAAGAAPA